MHDLNTLTSIFSQLSMPIAIVSNEGSVFANLPLRALVGLEQTSPLSLLGGLEARLVACVAGQSDETIQLPSAIGRPVFVKANAKQVTWEGGVATMLELQDVGSVIALSRRLDAAETRFNLLAQSAPIGIWEQDRVRDTWYFSPRVYELFGLPLDSNVDPKALFTSRIVPEDLVLVRAKAASAFRNRERYESLLRINMPDGTVRTLRATGLSKHAEDGSVSQFVGTLGLVSQDDASVTGSKATAETTGSQRAYLHVLDDLLEVSALQSGAELAAAEPFNLFDSLNKLVQSHFTGAESPVSLVMDPRAKTDFDGQGGCWRRIVSLMIDHAVMRCAASGVEVRLTIGETGHGVLVEVQDSGALLSHEAIANLFASPPSLDAVPPSPQAGWQVGFHLARLLARRMGGEVALSNAGNQGVVARLYVPFERSAALLESTKMSPIEAADSNGVGESALRVLVAEDNVANQRVISIILQQLGCDVTIAENGHVCVNMFADAHYDLVLMDLHMPVMDGYTATRTIRASGARGANALIVALTADARTEARLDAEAAGVDDFLTKPVMPGQIAAVIARAVCSIDGDTDQGPNQSPTAEVSISQNA